MIIDYYYSVLSDWAYLGGERLECLARRYGARVNHMPLRLGVVYAGTGGILLPKRSKQRQDYRIAELKRWRDYLGMPVNPSPRHYPTDDVLASCTILAAKARCLDVGALANAILRAIWAEERDISDRGTLERIVEGLGLDGPMLLATAQDSKTVQEFDRHTREAQERGVFGSPFYIFGDEIFWGQDRLEFLEDALARASGMRHLPRLIPSTQGGRM